MRRFNTEGPIRPEEHYHVPPLSRVNLEDVLELIRHKRYFVLHAPRQTGKTSALIALRDLLNRGGAGDVRCLYVNVEAGQAAREEVERAMRAILSALAFQARTTLGDESLASLWPGVLETSGPDGALRDVLARASESDPRPLVLLIDEIDALVGDTLLSMLRQLRAGYVDRPAHFPQSVVLCGVRDIRDYRIQSSSGAIVAGGSPFNIAAKSLRLGDFSEAETRALLRQHTEETGQKFTGEAVDEVWRLTRGQPWLVNALCADACFDHRAGRDRSRAIAAADVRAARERLVLARRTHLDQLAHKLEEDRVRRVVEPLLSGAGTAAAIPADDLQYARDLGLVRQDDPIAVANPIYREVIPRSLTWTTQAGFPHDPAWYVDADGGLRTGRLLGAFQEFFREHSEHWVERFQYREAGPQLLLQAFLQRIVNSGGRIEREYGLGRMRTDLLIVWPAGGAGRSAWKVVVECKLAHGSLERTVRLGLEQTRAYMERCGAGEGHLVVFDRTEGRSWDEKVYRREEAVEGARITIWGM